MTIKDYRISFAAIAAAAFLFGAPLAHAQTVGANDIGGVVTGANGPEAGVWVIAETTELPTKFARIVVTDDQGRYLIPDLPSRELQRLGARLWPGRFAEAARASPASTSTSPPCRRRTRPRPRTTTRRSTGTRC